MTDNFPPLPPGFALDNAAPGAPPPLPPGFVLDTAPGVAPAQPEPVAQPRVPPLVEPFPFTPAWLRSDLNPAANNGDVEWGEPGAVVPIQFNADGGSRLAMPSMVEDIITAIMAPGEALQGGMSDIDFDPITGEPSMINDEMIQKAAVGASVMAGGQTPAITGKTLMASGKAVPKTVLRSMSADGVPLSAAGPRVQQLGPEGMVADLGDNLRFKAAAIAGTPGPGQTTVSNALRGRKVGASDRVTQGVDDILGAAPVPSYVQSEIKTNMRNVGPEYDALLGPAAPVDETAVAALAAAMDNIVGREKGSAGAAAATVRGLLNVPGGDTLDTSATGLFSARRAIGDMLDANPGGYESEILTTAKRQLTELIETAAPGFKQIDEKYAELGEQGRALERGQTALGNERGDLRPQELNDYVSERAVPQGETYGPSGVPFRLSQGTRAEIDRLLGTKANDRVALNQMLKGESDWNNERLATIFGQDRTDRLYQLLENERAMAETENLALSGSKTSALQSAKEEVAGKRAPGPFRAAANVQFGDAIDGLFGALTLRNRDARNAAVADALTSKGDWTTKDSIIGNRPLPPATLIDLIMGGGLSEEQTPAGMSPDELLRAVYNR